MERFKLYNSKITILNYLAAFLMIGFAFVAPIDFFTENGPVENLESLVLILGIFFSVSEYRKNRNFKSFFLTIAMFLALCVGRELNWGRVYFTNDMGEIVKRRDWVLGPYIYYIVAPLFIGLLAYAIKTKFVQNAIILLQKAPIFILDFALVALMFAISSLAETSYVPEVIKHLNFAIEESAEVSMYFAVALIIGAYSRQNLLVNIQDKK